MLYCSGGCVVQYKQGTATNTSCH